MNRSAKTEAGSTSTADILAQVRISDAPEIMRLHELATEVQAEIAKAQDAGLSPVSLRWPSGQFALVFCEPGHTWPSAEIILAAYRQCESNSKTFPDGEISCKP
jgi:hypothetical protein